MKKFRLFFDDGGTFEVLAENEAEALDSEIPRGD